MAKGLGIKDIKAPQRQAVPAPALRRGGCWVIRSFTQEPVRVSRSGGTVSMPGGRDRRFASEPPHQRGFCRTVPLPAAVQTDPPTHRRW